jgi:hypothetical protein
MMALLRPLILAMTIRALPLPRHVPVLQNPAHIRLIHIMAILILTIGIPIRLTDSYLLPQKPEAGLQVQGLKMLLNGMAISSTG